MRRLHVHSWGSGPEVVLVHGGILGGREAWRAQRPLTERWTLLAPDRPGHGRTPGPESAFDTDAELVAAELLNRPVHLVGHSYGGIVAMYAAARRPGSVRSLTVIEPPCSAVAGEVPEVAELGRRTRHVIEARDLSLAQSLARFFDVQGVLYPVPDPLPEPLAAGTRALRSTRPPDEAEPPLAELRATGIPCLVVSGGARRGHEVICDTLAAELDAERVVLAGAGHLVQDLGEPFNAVLEEFLLSA